MPAIVATAPGSPRPLRAFSMVEVAISVVIVAGMTVAALNTVGASKSAQKTTSSRKIGSLLAHQLMTEILTKDYEDPDGVVIFGSELPEVEGGRLGFDDVDDYHMWSESPPENKDGSTIPDLDGFARQVSVAFVNSFNLSSTSITETGVKRIAVTITYNNAQVASLTAIRTKARDRAGQP